jgi:outer membrane protein
VMAFRNLLSLFVILIASTCHSADLNITLSGETRLDNGSGKIHILLFDSPDGFEGFKRPFRKEQFDPEQGPFLLSEIASGSCAFLIYLDSNGNGYLDKNFIGIPTEPAGFSNNYRPKGGPPTFGSSAINLEAGKTFEAEVHLERPLGKRGRFGAGIGFMGKSSPFESSSIEKSTFIPAIIWVGNRVQIFGPVIQVGLLNLEQGQIATRLSYRMGGYDEDQSEIVNGMGDRKDTLMAALGVRHQLPWGLGINGSLGLDALGIIGGFEGNLSLSRSFQIGKSRLTPTFSLNYLSPRMSAHDFGVTESQALPTRPSYDPGYLFSPVVGLSGFFEISEATALTSNLSMEILDEKARRSPIVTESHIYSFFLAVIYML